MHAVVTALIVLTAALHVFFFVLEALLWQTRYGRKVFGTTREFAAQSAALAKNQGLYNLFLAAGLVWALILGDAPHARDVATFFLVCVVVAGVVGALTVSWRILIIQAVPAALALVLGLV